MSTALFGSNARSASKNLVEFKAGKMELKGKVVHPDKRKGLVYLYQSDDDGVMHFCWKDRTTGSVEEDLMIFPDDCEYRRVKACTTGRAYVLKFRSSSRRLFFWMQESRTDKDDEHCRKINELLNNPPSPGSHSTPSRSAGGGVGSGSGGGSGVLSSELGNLRESDLHNIIGNISQQQLMQILGSGVPNLSSLLGPNSGTSSRGSSSSSSSISSSTTSSAATTTATTTTSAATPPTASTPTTVSTPTLSTTTSTAAPAVSAMETSASGGSESSAASPAKEGPIQLADLQSILSGMMGQDDGASGAGAGVDLSPALTAEALQPILSNPSFVDKLRPYLPPTSDPLPPAEQLRGTVTSPQFKQAVSLFSHALQSGQLGPLIKQFGLGEEAVLAAAAADMEAFVKALGKSSGGDAAAADGDKDDDDDNMAVD